jgi:sugar/nucleoside kinase (ribokinase family)
MKGGVLCAGSLVLDTIIRSVDELRWGTTTLVDEIERHVGGNGANTARALALCGVPVRLVGTAGQDEAGDFVLRELVNAGVDVSFVRRVPASNAATIVLVNARGDRQFLHRLGSSEAAFADGLAFAPDMIAGIRHSHLASLFVLPNLRRFAPEILQAAKLNGLTTSLDVNWDARGEWMRILKPCLEHLDVLFLNEDESRMLTGFEDPARAAAALRECGARIVVQKLSREGCAIYAEDDSVRCAPFAVEAVDSTGAGDCFAAGFLKAWLRGDSLAQAGELGNAAGALAVSATGATSGLERCADVEEYARNAR